MIPKLRFPEFRDKEEWDVTTFDKIYSFYVTNSFSRDELTYQKGTVKNIHYGDIHTKFSTLFDIKNEKVPSINPLIEIKKIPSESYCIEGDMIFADASEDLKDVGKSIEIVNINHEKLVSGLHTILARQIQKKLIVGFGGYLFKSDWIRTQIQKEAQGAKVLGISAKRLSTINIAYPTNHLEQQKIAATLSSLDDLITAQSEKIKALQAHKKSLMQQLFPAEGERVPRLRFPEFLGEGDWEEVSLGQKVDSLSGYPFKSIEISEDSRGIPLLRGINITEGFIRHSKDIDRYFLGNTQQLQKYRLQINDLVIGMDGSKVGKNSSLITKNESGSLLIQRVACLRTKDKETISIEFIFQQINSNKFHTYVERINTSGGIPHISINQINEFMIGFPSFAEQQKIAATLSSLDDLIKTQNQKLEALKKHKKGLMQQLFPNPIEETV